MRVLLQQLREGEVEETLIPGMIWRGAVTLLVAESSAGKTTFTHRMAWSFSQDKVEFLGMKVHTPLTILHIDMESPKKAKEITLECMVPTNDNWVGHTVGSNSPQILQYLREGKFDLAIVDNLQLARPVRDEQDNAMAIAQIGYFKALASHRDAGILTTFNTGKPSKDYPHQASTLHLARGASARIDQADVAINMVEENKGTFTLFVVKSRFGNKGEWWTYKWRGDYNYELIDHQLPPSGRM